MLNQGVWLGIEKENQGLSESCLTRSFSLKTSPLSRILQETEYTNLQWSFPMLCQSRCLSLDPQDGWPHFGHCPFKEPLSEVLWWLLRYQLLGETSRWFSFYSPFTRGSSDRSMKYMSWKPSQVPNSWEPNKLRKLPVLLICDKSSNFGWY